MKQVGMQRRWFWMALAAIGLISLVGMGIWWQGQGQAAPATAGMSVMAVDNVRIREAPSLGAARLSYVPWGTVVGVQAVDTTGEWYLVNHDGIQGWTASDWYQVAGGQANAAAVQPAAQNPLPSNQPGLAPLPTLPPNFVRPSPPASANTSPPAAASGLAPLPSGRNTAETNASNANVNTAAPTTSNAVEAEVAAPRGLTVRYPDDGLTVTSEVTLRTTADLRMRSEPSLQGERVAVIPMRDEVRLLAISAAGEWYQVEYDGVQGWSAAAWLEVSMGSLPAFGQVEVGQYALVEQDLNLRANPGEEYAILGGINAGEYLLLRGVDASGEWYQVAYDDLIGWVANDFVSLAPDYEGGVSVSIIGTFVRPMASVGMVPMLVAAEADSQLMGTLPSGAAVEVVDISSDGQWYAVLYDERRGWVSAELVEPDAEANAEAEANRPQIATVSVGIALLLSEPDIDSPSISTLLIDDAVEVLDAESQPAWVEVAVDVDGERLRGWVLRTSLALE